MTSAQDNIADQIEPVGTADRAPLVQDDRAWFRANRHKNCRIRPAHPGEPEEIALRGRADISEAIRDMLSFAKSQRETINWMVMAINLKHGEIARLLVMSPPDTEPEKCMTFATCLFSDNLILDRGGW